VPVVGTAFGTAERLGAWKARWGVGRMHYLVPPGLYAVGEPGENDPVLVTANYKMSFDLVRRALAGRSAWLLVLETYGINVWCAAGKGTFGTEELVARVASSGLPQVVAHRLLLLPLLGAPGVSAHEVRARTGFEVRFSSARAEDIPRLLDGGLVVEPWMRELTFTLRERLVLVPVELVIAAKWSLPLLLLIALASCWRGGAFVPSAALRPLLGYAGAVLAGTVLAPLLLPWLPTRSFAAKGAVVGLAWAAILALAPGAGRGIGAAAPFLLLPAVSSFLALNFTGSTPYTSLSGVRREMRIAMPLLAGSLALGIALWAAGLLLPR
jgi:acetyl-CoA decarbonylase/synthase complex subunit gamma